MIFKNMFSAKSLIQTRQNRHILFPGGTLCTVCMYVYSYEPETEPQERRTMPLSPMLSTPLWVALQNLSA